MCVRGCIKIVVDIVPNIVQPMSLLICNMCYASMLYGLHAYTFLLISLKFRFVVI